jgi:hypothetical protein
MKFKSNAPLKLKEIIILFLSMFILVIIPIILPLKESSPVIFYVLEIGGGLICFVWLIYLFVKVIRYIISGKVFTFNNIMFLLFFAVGIIIIVIIVWTVLKASLI